LYPDSGGLSISVSRRGGGLRAGDQAALGTLSSIDTPGWYGALTRAHGLDHHAAADVSQVTWLRLCTTLGSLRQPERVGGWLATTAG
jgi:DNA-directed RNA polymerase specialized sigma24 family protein